MNETDAINLASDDIDEGFNFTERLARYYSDFLATDFKKGRLPKRRFQTRDRKGRRAGISQGGLAYSCYENMSSGILINLRYALINLAASAPFMMR